MVIMPADERLRLDLIDMLPGWTYVQYLSGSLFRVPWELRKNIGTVNTPGRLRLFDRSRGGGAFIFDADWLSLTVSCVPALHEQAIYLLPKASRTWVIAQAFFPPEHTCEVPACIHELAERTAAP